MFRRLGEILLDLITYSDTGNEAVDNFIFYSSTALLVVSVIALLLLIFLNPNLRQRKRPEDRFLFGECIMMLIYISAELIYRFSNDFSGIWVNVVYYVIPSLNEFLFMMMILQWTVFVDYCLYRSMDHVRRRYKHAAIPIFAVTGLDIVQSIIIYANGIDTEALLIPLYIMQFIKVAVELGYIIIAIRLVEVHAKETREPRFIRLSAFIIPFILGGLFRFHGAVFMTLGIILTYAAVIRRDRYLDHDTGFYSREFMDYLSRYRDRKEYAGGNGILINAAGHGQDMSKLLSEVKPAGSSVFALGDDRFLLLSESLRNSAATMAVATITDAAQTSDDPYTPEIITVRRGRDESAGDFAARLLS